MKDSAKKILVVEKNKDFRLSLCDFLQNMGFMISETDIVEEVIKVALIENPDLILMELSNEKSLELLYQIRQKRSLASIPVLASSDDGGYGIELFSNIEKFGSDFIGYLTKPLNFNELADQINSILQPPPRHAV